jgi:hypothetical protein
MGTRYTPEVVKLFGGRLEPGENIARLRRSRTRFPGSCKLQRPVIRQLCALACRLNSYKLTNANSLPVTIPLLSAAVMALAKYSVEGSKMPRAST